MTTRKCYAKRAKLKTEQSKASQECGFLDLDLWLYDLEREEKRPRPIDDLKEVKIGPADHQKPNFVPT